MRELELSSGQRQTELRGLVEALRSEVSAASQTRLENLEARAQEQQQRLDRRLDGLQLGCTEDVEALRAELRKLQGAAKRLEEQQELRLSGVREEWSSELRGVLGRLPERHDEGPLRTEMGLKLSDLGGRVSDLAGKLEQLELELTSTRATRESFEYRVRDVTVEAQQQVRHEISKVLDSRLCEAQVEVLKAEIQSLKTQLRQEQSTMAALDEQLLAKTPGRNTA